MVPHSSPPRSSRRALFSPAVHRGRRAPSSLRGYISPSGSLWPVLPRLSDTAISWVWTALIAILAAGTRFIGLADITDIGTPIFDEKHYVPQSWQILHHGGVESNPGYGLVVHPPLGKQIIALSEALLGYNPWGWRAASACAGVLCVILLIRAVRRLSSSTYTGVLAGLLLTVDSLSTIVSRTGLLDIFLTLFMLISLMCLLVDRDATDERAQQCALDDQMTLSPLGPVWGVRWWRLAAGVSLGLGLAVKWSALYLVAVLGIVTVMWDVGRRRRYHVQRPWLGALWRDTPLAFVDIVMVSLSVYVASWWGWFRSETAVFRHADKNLPSASWLSADGPLSWLPGGFRSLVYYHQEMLRFHSSLTNSEGYHHPWESKPWDWIIDLQPLLYFYEKSPHGTCSSEGCVQSILLLGTPLLWWGGVIALFWAFYRVIGRRDTRYALVLAGYCATWLPWLILWDRQMYFFYAAPLAPFMVMGMALMLTELTQWSPPPPTSRMSARRARLRNYLRSLSLGPLLAACAVGLIVANYVWLLPLIMGIPISPTLWMWQHWLPTW